MRLAPLALLLLGVLAPATGARDCAQETDTNVLLAVLAIAPEEREERLALALALFRSGDCEGALARLDDAARESDGLGRRLLAERARIAAWIELRDAFLAELAQSGKPLSIELAQPAEAAAKRVSSPIERVGDELVLSRGPVKRVSVRALAPEALVTAIPKERFDGARAWLGLYPLCVAGNPKWKRLAASDEASAELARDAGELYPRLAALAPQVLAVDALARSAVPTDAAGARALLEQLEKLLALGREAACVAARLGALGELAARLLAQASQALQVADLVHGAVGLLPGDAVRLTYGFASAAEIQDWRRDDAYLAELRQSLPPVQGDDEAARFAPGPQGFTGEGTTCWRHALEFTAPLRVRYRVRWEPIEGHAGQAFTFALGLLADGRGGHVRVHELGFLYVVERDQLYTAVRPKGDATVQLGQTYAMELFHDGARARVLVEGTPRVEAEAPTHREGGVFLWLHSDLSVSVPWIEIEGRVTPAALERARARWAADELAELGLAPDVPAKRTR